MNQHDLQLQPLRIWPRWSVVIHKFYELDPPDAGDPLGIEGFPDADGWMAFEQDLLQLSFEHSRGTFVLDLSWVPYWDPRGQFHLVLIRDDNWREPLFEVHTRSRTQVVSEIEALLRLVSESGGTRPIGPITSTSPQGSCDQSPHS